MTIRSILEHSSVFKVTKVWTITTYSVIMFIILVLLVMTNADTFAFMFLVVTTVLCLYLFFTAFSRNKWYNGYRFYRSYKNNDVHLDIIKIGYEDLHSTINAVLKSELANNISIEDCLQLVRTTVRTTPRLSSNYYSRLIDTEEPEEDTECIELYIYSIINNENLRSIVEISTAELGDIMLDTLKEDIKVMKENAH